MRVQLSVALQGIVTQQLLPTADGQGRVCGAEVLVPTPAVRNLIREGKTHQIYSALQTGGTHGMQTMDAALADLVRRGKITRELAESRSSTPEELRRLMGTVRVALDDGHLRLQGARPRRASRRAARSRPRTSRPSPSQLRAKGLIVLDIEEKKPADVGDLLGALQERQGRRS